MRQLLNPFNLSPEDGFYVSIEAHMSLLGIEPDLVEKCLIHADDGLFSGLYGCLHKSLVFCKDKKQPPDIKI